MCTLRKLAVSFSLVACGFAACGQTYVRVSKDAPSKLMHLDVNVTAKDGTPVTGLQASDFKLTADGAASQVLGLREVTAGTMPTEVVVLIDNINSPFHTISLERKQLENFLRGNGGKLGIPLTIAVAKDSGLTFDEQFTTDGTVLADKLHAATIGLHEWPRSAGDGVEASMEKTGESLTTLTALLKREAVRPGRKVIVWISPGWSGLTGPQVRLSQEQRRQVFQQIVGLTELMRRGNITLDNVNPLGVEQYLSTSDYYVNYMKPVRDPLDAEYGNLLLPVLALHSGGLVLQNSNDVGPMLAECLKGVTTYYQLSFDGTGAGATPAFHALKVQTTMPDTVVRTRPGYYTLPGQ